MLLYVHNLCTCCVVDYHDDVSDHVMGELTADEEGIMALLYSLHTSV